MFEIAEYIGIIAFAISGFFTATKNNLDLLGVLISVFLTALGGGIIRDILVHKVPYTFSHDIPAIIVLLVMIIMILFKFHKKNSLENKPLFIVSDSIGLISFSITGALIGVQVDFNLTGVIALAFLTAVGGGITRDIIINEIPFVFKTGFYGTLSILVAICIYILDYFHNINFLTLSIIFISGILLRIIAFYKKWSIPLK